jgi:hypothetical protein
MKLTGSFPLLSSSLASKSVERRAEVASITRKEARDNPCAVGHGTGLAPVRRARAPQLCQVPVSINLDDARQMAVLLKSLERKQSAQRCSSTSGAPNSTSGPRVVGTPTRLDGSQDSWCAPIGFGWTYRRIY